VCCTELLEEGFSRVARTRFIRFAGEPRNEQIYIIGQDLFSESEEDAGNVSLLSTLYNDRLFAALFLPQGQSQKALEIFTQAETHLATPERIRLEVVNYQAEAAFSLGDLEQCSIYVASGISGALAVGSQKRYQKIEKTYQQMLNKWPKEKRVETLGELFHEAGKNGY
jgi:tetratricopeptide (TPR) repeat protein